MKGLYRNRKVRREEDRTEAIRTEPVKPPKREPLLPDLLSEGEKKGQTLKQNKSKEKHHQLTGEETAS